MQQPALQICLRYPRTGATGYIGGDALVEIVKAHPEWEITCSVRNSDKGAKVAAEFPRVKLVYGDLDATEMIEEECSKADIVYSEFVPLLDSESPLIRARLCQL